MILKHHSYRPRRIFNSLCTDSRFFLRRGGVRTQPTFQLLLGSCILTVDPNWPLYSEFECETGSSFCELHYGTFLRKLSLLSLAFTRLGGKLGQNSPTVQFPFSSPEPPGGLSTRTRRLWGHRI